MNTDIFKLQGISIKLVELKNSDKSFKYLLDSTTMLGIEYIDIFNMFFKDISCREMHTFMQDCIYAEAARNYRFRFMVVDTEVGYVIVCFKVVDVRGTEPNYFTISIPLKGIMGGNVSDVLKVLCEFECIKYVNVLCDRDDKYHINNYYNTIEDFESKMNKSKWKSKKGINKLSKIIDVKCKICSM